jgi:hypothetical protein
MDYLVHMSDAIAWVESRSHRTLSGEFVVGDRRCLELGPAGELGIHQITKIAYRDVVSSPEYRAHVKSRGMMGGHYSLIDPKYSEIIFRCYAMILQRRWGDKWIAHYNPGDKTYERKVTRALFTVERNWQRLWEESMARGSADNSR